MQARLGPPKSVEASNYLKLNISITWDKNHSNPIEILISCKCGRNFAQCLYCQPGGRPCWRQSLEPRESMLTRKAKHTNQPIKYIGYGWLWAMGFQCVHNCKKIRLTKIIKPLTKVNRQHPKSYKHHEKNDGRLFVGTSASQPASQHLAKHFWPWRSSVQRSRQRGGTTPARLVTRAPSQPIPIPREPKTDRSSH